jgi:hypothetical protein
MFQNGKLFFHICFDAIFYIWGKIKGDQIGQIIASWALGRNTTEAATFSHKTSCINFFTKNSWATF